jgi:hypothetical protein
MVKKVGNFHIPLGNSPLAADFIMFPGPLSWPKMGHSMEPNIHLSLVKSLDFSQAVDGFHSLLKSPKFSWWNHGKNSSMHPDMEVSEHGATPIAGWVYFMTPILKWMIWGYPPWQNGNLHLSPSPHPLEPGWIRFPRPSGCGDSCS